MSPTRTLLCLSSLLGAFLLVGCDGHSLETPADQRASTPDSGRSTAAPGSALLSWYPPRQRTDGSPLRGLAGYRVYFGKGANPGRYILEITNPGQTSQFIDNLGQGTWYFSITAYDRQGRESGRSPRVSKTIG